MENENYLNYIEDFYFPIRANTMGLTDQARFMRMMECQKMTRVISEELFKVKVERHTIRYGYGMKISLRPVELSRFGMALDEIITDWSEKYEAWQTEGERLKHEIDIINNARVELSEYQVRQQHTTDFHRTPVEARLEDFIRTKKPKWVKKLNFDT